MKKLLTLTLSGLALTAVNAASLTEAHVIVLPENPAVYEKTAAAELQTHLRESTGIECQIIQDRNTSGAPAFYLGWGPEAETLISDIDRDSLAPDEIIIRTFSDGSVVLAGEGTRGTLYAVYTFLEEAAGVRWLARDCTVIPRHETLDIPEMDIRYASPFTVRNSDAAMFFPINWSTFAARCKLNGNFAAASHGGNVAMKYVGGCHSFERLVPDRSFYNSHKDWFTDDFILPFDKPELYSWRDGQRITGGSGQLCLTNPETMDILIHNTKALINWKKPDTARYYLSQNDNQNFCLCENCTAKAAELGNQTDLILWFLNNAVEILQQDYPGLTIETLSYQYTLPPPLTVKPHPDLYIRVCLIEAGTRNPFYAPDNAFFADIIDGWNKITDNVTIWHYVPNFSNLGLIHPNFRSYHLNYRYFAELGIKDVYSEETAPGGSFGYFPELRTYLCTKLMWDPSLDPDILTDEFLAGYYGDAAKYMREYIDMYDNLMANAPEHATLDCYELDTIKWCPYEALEYGSYLLDMAAEAVAADPVISKRVANIRTSHDWTILWRTENTPLRDFYRLATVPSYQELRAGIEERLLAVDKTPNSAELFTHLGKNIKNGLAALDNQLGTPLVPVQVPRELQYVPADSLAMLNPESLVSGTPVIQDYLAPEKEAKRLHLGNLNLAARITLPAAAEPFTVYAYAEVRLPQAVTNASGTAFICGYYFYGTNFGQMTKVYVDASELSNGGYTLVPLGPVDVAYDQQIYFQGVNNPTVPEILVSRIWLVRD